MARSESTEDLGEPIPFDPDFRGPLKNRSCTDIICLFLFIVFIGCWAGVGIYAFTNGDPNTLLAPKDSAGRRCGLDESVQDKPYLFFFDLTKCLNPAVAFTGCPTRQVCVEQCPDKNFIWDQNLGSTNADLKDLICDDSVSKPDNPEDANRYVEDKKCAKWYAKSTPFEKRCVPIIDKNFFETIKESIGATMDELTKSIEQLKRLTQAEQVGQNIVDDLVKCWWKILIGIGVAVLVSIIYIIMMRWIAAIMVWLSLLGAIAILTFATYLCTVKYIDLKNNPDKKNESDNNNVVEQYLAKKDTWLVLLIISASVLGIILLIVVFLRKRILLAIALVKEGSKAVSSVTSVLFFPVFPWVLQLAVIAYAITVGLFLSTTGNPLYKVRNFDDSCKCTSGSISKYTEGQECTPEDFSKCVIDCGGNAEFAANATCKFVAMNNPELYPYMQAFNVFAFLWGAFFTSALGQMILASVFATWYWTFQKSNLPFFAVTEAAARTLRYHIGTLAFGSLIITICRMIRLVLEYIDHKLKKYDNGVTKALLCCCKCFFWCLEKFLKFINRNAYIMCAIHGKNFCGSAKDAFLLLMRNIVRVFVLDKVTDFLFFLGKVLITVGVGSLAYLVFATDLTSVDNEGINYELVPVVTIMIFTYLITTIFFSVYSMAVDTLFLCFLEDCERNDGSAEKPYYMSRNLMGIFGKKNKLE